MTPRPSLGTVRLPPLVGGRDESLWPALIDLAGHLPKPWALIGGQMVYLHGVLANRAVNRVTEDIDLVFDLRVDVEAIAKAHAVLERLGYHVDGLSADGLAHRYVDGRGIKVDILAPDKLGERARPRMRTPAGRTVAVPGGTRALRNACAVEAHYSDRRGTLFVPDLATAVDSKINALGLPGPSDGGRSRHLDDIAFLVSLIDDPDDFLGANPCRSSVVDELDDPNHPSWLLLGQHAEDGFAAWGDPARRRGLISGPVCPGSRPSP